MKKFTGLFSLALAALILTPAAKAQDSGIFVEPSLTYELGDSKTNYPAPLSNSSGEISGFGLGGRGGFHVNEAIFVGLDGRYSFTKFKDSNVNYDADATGYNLAPVVGFQMPDIGLRVWGSYVVMGELNPEESRGWDVKYTDAMGPRIGAGFRIASISVNLEYQDLKYDKATLEAVGPFNPGDSFDNVELSNKSWIASVSFPLEL